MEIIRTGRDIYRLSEIKDGHPVIWTFLVLSLLSSFHASAQLQLAKVFSDNMVVQREEPVHIWGRGLPGKEVRVTFDMETKSVQVKGDSVWSCSFRPRAASPKAHSLTVISAEEKMTVNNVLIGDVWLCLGQSNMEWPMKSEEHFQDELSQGKLPMLRYYNPTYAGKGLYGEAFPDSILRRLTAKDFYYGTWEESDSRSLPRMSAVAHYFGKRISDEIDVPIGLMNLAIGGAPIETFIGSEVLASDSLLAPKAEGSWLKNDKMPVWVRERGVQNVGRMSLHQDDRGPNHAFKPGFAFESGIASLLPFGIKGIIWYQGESNAQEVERVAEYGRLMELMVSDYRRRWKRMLPFYYVQLSSIETVRYKRHLWPEFRNVQRIAMDLIAESGMAVSSDIGSRHDVHPRNKRDVGERLARWALNKTYKRNIIPSGPLPRKATY